MRIAQMFHIFVLLLATRFASCEGIVLDDGTPIRTKEDDMLIPLVAADMGVRHSLYADIENLDRRRFIRSLFMLSFYEPKCDIGDRLIVKPVYYWPGQRVDLRCAMCRKAFIFNGQIKYWHFMHWKNVKEALEDKKTLKDSKHWKELYAVLTTGDQKWRTAGTMPYPHPKGKQKVARRPGTTFLQRNGVLTIFQPSWEVEGLYRCLDVASRGTMNFVYYLIAMMPMFVYRKTEDKVMDQLASECSAGNLGFPDTNWKFRHIPPSFIRDTSHACTDTEEQIGSCLHWILRSPAVNDSKEWPLVNEQDPEFVKQFVNLQVVLEWAEWTPCNAGQRVRTREGHCYLRKINPSAEVKGISSITMGDPYRWVNDISILFETVDEFSELGMRFFSGPVAKSIYTHSMRIYSIFKDAFDSCYSADAMSTIYGWDATVLYSFGVRPDIKGFLNTENRVCFEYYSNMGGKDRSPTRVVLGTHTTETERCPDSES